MYKHFCTFSKKFNLVKINQNIIKFMIFIIIILLLVSNTYISLSEIENAEK